MVVIVRADLVARKAFISEVVSPKMADTKSASPNELLAV
ncbi:hypothetical protein ES703_52391 [subsurface metagenome]